MLQHLQCPECGGKHIVEAVADWHAVSTEERDNCGTLVECQCADCGRSIWLGDDAFKQQPQSEAA